VKLPVYARYKPSGVEWLGDVPEHWEVQRLKYVASANDDVLNEDTPPDWEFLYVDIGSVNAVAGITAKESMVFEDAPSRARRLVANGDTIVSTVRTYLKAIAPIHQPESNLVVSTGFAVVRPRKVEPSFLSFYLRSGYFVETVVSRSTGVSYPATNSSEILTIPILLPKPAEQQAIAAFLDRETGRVDRLVAKKRELIKRLKEKRTALISRTVTRGLPPAAARAAGLPENPPLKPSALDWLGDIPKHWRVMALKWRSRCHSGDGISTEDVTPEPTPERSVPVIGGNGVMGYCDSSNCDHPVLVIGRVGALCGNVHLIAPPAWITDNALVMPIDAATFSQKYLAAVLRTRNLNDLADKTAQPLITGTRVRNERVPVPPLPEQAAIAAYLDEETAKLDALLGKVEAAVERLQEYRTALITAAVTGKIDVRKAAT
jgi:type I restriction enzyme S subunit